MKYSVALNLVHSRALNIVKDLIMKLTGIKLDLYCTYITLLYIHRVHGDCGPLLDNLEAAAKLYDLRDEFVELRRQFMLEGENIKKQRKKHARTENIPPTVVSEGIS